ncbi:MAG: hypothetical protein WBF42_10525 [Terracidiphilus sp.]
MSAEPAAATTGRKLAPVRGTQKLVDQMGWVFRRPLLVAMEIAWRWLFGIPLLWLCWRELQKILAAVPPSSTGLANLDAQNPWVAVVQLANVWEQYAPHFAAAAAWLAPAAAVAWAVISGVGRAAVLKRMEPGLRFRPMGMIALQAAWLAMLALIFWCWFRSMQWVAATHITATGEADLVGYSIWTIFLSLGFFTLWGMVNWPLSVAPMLMLLERCSAPVAVGRGLRLGKGLSSKLTEVNLVMGIVKLALIVLTMVFSAAPLPFSDQLGPSSLHMVWAGSTVFYLVASDYFQVVRLKSFVELWRVFRGGAR